MDEDENFLWRIIFTLLSLWIFFYEPDLYYQYILETKSEEGGGMKNTKESFAFWLMGIVCLSFIIGFAFLLVWLM